MDKAQNQIPSAGNHCGDSYINGSAFSIPKCWDNSQGKSGVCLLLLLGMGLYVLSGGYWTRLGLQCIGFCLRSSRVRHFVGEVSTGVECRIC